MKSYQAKPEPSKLMAAHRYIDRAEQQYFKYTMRQMRKGLAVEDKSGCGVDDIHDGIESQQQSRSGASDPAKQECSLSPRPDSEADAKWRYDEAIARGLSDAEAPVEPAAEPVKPMQPFPEIL